ncbi:MAG: hypothetical protein M0R51_16860 [Clostridia bacterium]|jgi:hypothetical protein|nr:hypothetical protein [Clostridia bacterium]
MSFLNCPICGHPKTTYKGEIYWGHVRCNHCSFGPLYDLSGEGTIKRVEDSWNEWVVRTQEYLDEKDRESIKE